MGRKEDNPGAERPFELAPGLEFAFVASFGWASCAAASLSPLRQPAALDAAAYGGWLLGVFVLGAGLGRARIAALASIALIAAAALGLPREASPALAAAAAWWIARRETAARGALTVAFAQAAAAMLACSLARAFAPDLVAAPIDRSLIGWWAQSRLPADVGPSVYGALLLPVALAGIVASAAAVAARICGVIVVLASLAASRWLESAWPIAAGAVLAPALLSSTLATRGVLLERWSRVRLAGWTIATLSAAVLATTTAFGVDGSAPRARTIGFVTAMHGTFERASAPDRTDPDFDAPPRFGEFRRMIERYGATVVDVDDPADLERVRCDALVTINFSGPGAEPLIAPVRSAVQAGAELLVLADHTDLFGQIEPTDRLLEDTGVALAFDSAVPLGVGSAWGGCVTAGRDPLFGPHRDGERLGWSVGCSLHVAAPARTLLAGSLAFSDRGDRAKGGGLGDLQRARSEALGRLPLAACATLGEGEVLAFGDTSALQDSALLDGRDFGRRLTAWLLGAGELDRGPGDRRGLAWLACAALLVVCCLPTRAAGSLVALAVLAPVESLVEARLRRAWLSHEPIEALVAMPVDGAPGRAASDGERIDPLIDVVQARGWVLESSSAAALARDADVVVLTDPWAPLDEQRADEWVEFVERGGSLVLMLGERGARACSSLLERWGLELGMHLGRGAQSSWDGELAQRMPPPTFESSFEIQGEGLSRVEVLARCFDRPVVVRGTHGAGSWVLVADAGLAWSSHGRPDSGGTHRGATTLQYVVESVVPDRTQEAR